MWLLIFFKKDLKYRSSICYLLHIIINIREYASILCIYFSSDIKCLNIYKYDIKEKFFHLKML
ncbi:hypothetical protein PFBG_02305 [Plasmodium falciparum 7G8]|uniref:Uncharacterized protein n=1 Tax=Plasmodium falciparum (isolate 7G8) TaxID=57266 RepID=W7F2W0_PLAF8|nr:hypothetical protein PFBG_02305 [Plasmodium falciparum 7G8]